MGESAWVARSPFEHLKNVGAGADPAGVVAQDQCELQLAIVIVRQGRREALAQRVRERYGIELPVGNVRVRAEQISFAGLGPETWLACRAQAGHDFVASLRADLASLVSVSDQSDGYAVLRLSGPKVRETLAKLIPLDLHPRVFKVGDVASTVASHMGVMLWRLEDSADGLSVFEVAVFRSLASSFQHALSESAAEFGFRALPR
jgi:methylglutamate dehydrogenase subunit D